MSDLHVVTITVRHAGYCETCEGRIKAGERVHWMSGAGIWHLTCANPRNAEVHARAAQRRQELGIDPRPFGSAPMLKEKGER